MLTGFVHGTLHEEWTHTWRRGAKKSDWWNAASYIFLVLQGFFYKVKGIEKRSVTIMMPIDFSHSAFDFLVDTEKFHLV